jgi:tripartite-type tricarboxylate transporter receptor subunit TctC
MSISIARQLENRHLQLQQIREYRDGEYGQYEGQQGCPRNTRLSVSERRDEHGGKSRRSQAKQFAKEDSPFQSIADVVAKAKAQPGTYTYGQSATLYQLSMERFKQLEHIELTPIPYKGPSEAMKDLLAGNISMTPDSLGSVSQMVQSGWVRPLSVFSATRMSNLPDVPTMIELGYKDFVFDGWIGLLAPADTPPSILDKLANAIQAAWASNEIRRLYGQLSLETTSTAPAEFVAMLVNETRRYEEIARAGGIPKQ